MHTISLAFFTIISAALAAPLPRALPAPVSTATAKTYLSQREYLMD